MKTEVATTLAVMAAVSSARNLHITPGAIAKREVPQEHSHRKFIIGVKAALDLNNRFDIVDPVFALLGNGAAAEGAGEIVNLDCLQQIIADEAFSNARAINDIDGMANALLYRALERNTLTVGEASILCNEIALNPEVEALQQHQDPASDDADDINGALELELARQLATIGADPLLALESATFEAGEIGDPTGAGNSCNDETDDEGCIFTEDLLTPVVSEADILEAVADILDAVADIVAAADDEEEVEEEEEEEVEEEEQEEEESDVGIASVSSSNVQAFAGDLGGAAPAVVEVGGDRPFEVNGATFNNLGAALQRSCSVQNNACFNAANSGQIADGTAACQQQEQDCRAQAAAAARKMFKRQNLQSFGGALGGAAPAVVEVGGDRPFEVNGATFNNLGAALQRSCSVQNNACFNAANSGQIADGTTACQQQEQDCRAQAGAVARKMRRGLHARQGLDFGSCSDPSIQFALLDGRNEESFGPANGAEFNHGSANAVRIISDFICGRLASSCDASEDTVAACENASQAAQAAQADGQDGAQVAQVFNGGLSV